MANATNVTKANSTGTPPNGLYPPPPMVANNTNTTDFADGYVVSAFPSESHVSADSDTDPRPLSTAQASARTRRTRMPSCDAKP